MKAALSTLTAATTRARRSAPAQACTAANTGTMNRPPAIASPARSIAKRMPRHEPNSVQKPVKFGIGATPMVDQPRSIANTPSRTAPDHRRQQDDASGRQPGCQARADRDRDREHRQAGGHHLLVAAEHVLDQRRHQRERDRTDQPEPAGHEGAPQQPRILAQELQQAAGGCEDVLLHHQVGRGLAGARDEQARAPAHQREHDHQHRELGGIAAVLGGKPAHDGAEQDGDEGRALDQRVAGRQLGAGEVVGQDAVFDRTEQRRDHAEQEQRDEQHRHANAG